MRIATAALKKEIRIMRTPEDASKLSHQVFWNKKIQGNARSPRHRWSGHTKEHGYRLHEIAAHLGVHYATVSRQLKRTEEQSGNA
jgi:hypothetical protein